MNEGRGVASEVAQLIREHREQICTEAIAGYDRRYVHSRGYTLPEEVRVNWTLPFIDGMANDLEGSIDPRRYQTCGGDMVLLHEEHLVPIVTFLEAELFYARIVSSFVWRAYVGDAGKLEQAIRALESSVGASIRANVDDYLGGLCAPGALSSILALHSPKGLWADEAKDAQWLPDNRQSGSIGSSAPELTERERKVFELLMDGLTNKEIASKLGMKLSTVKGHVGRLFDKFGVQSRTELVALVLKSGDGSRRDG